MPGSSKGFVLTGEEKKGPAVDFGIPGRGPGRREPLLPDPRTSSSPQGRWKTGPDRLREAGELFAVRLGRGSGGHSRPGPPEPPGDQRTDCGVGHGRQGKG